ncbi:MAG: ORF6N domain-containing protein [Ginsengibacter sp.]
MHPSTIQHEIYEVMSQKIMFDFDLAEMYEVENRALKQTVKRNIVRFPNDFMFQLSKIEWREVITNCEPDQKL